MEYFKEVLIRAYPAFVNGNLISYNNDFETKRFNMEWEGSKKNDAPTVVYIPHLSKLKKDSHNKLGKVEIKIINETDAGWVFI